MKQLAQERTPYWHKVGTSIQGLTSVDDILREAGLDYTVEKMPLFYENKVANNLMQEISQMYATVRTDTGKPLGIVGKGYEVVQNREAFDFIEDCLGEGITFTKAGTYNRGERVFIIGEAPTVKVMGDDVHPTILFKNSHDGSGSVQGMFTPMRLVCENGLMIPIEGHENGIVRFSISHTKNVRDRLNIVEELIMRNNQYIEALQKRAEELANTKFSKEQFDAMALELAVGNVETTESGLVLTRGQEAVIADLNAAYEEADVANFKGTAWGAILAASDYDTHKINSRNTGNNEYEFERVAYGMTILVAAAQIVARMTGRGFRR